MFCSKPAHDLLDKVHFRSLKARFLCFQTSFEDLLHRANSVTIHDRNLTLMLFEVFKSHHKLGPRIMHDIFQVNENAYSLRSGITFTVPKYQRNGTNIFDFRAV